MKNVLYVLIGVIAGFILAGILFYVSRAPTGAPIVLQPAPTQAPIVIQVTGGVARPGLYDLPDGARVQDAIDAAGGLITTADTSTLNLAERVMDGQQVSVPCVDGSCPMDETALDLPNDSADETAANDDGSTSTAGDLIDINTASLEELNTLPGIGPTIAQRIIDYRDQNGPFYIVDDLLNVSGIGDATLEEIRPLITTGY